MGQLASWGFYICGIMFCSMVPISTSAADYTTRAYGFTTPASGDLTIRKIEFNMFATTNEFAGGYGIPPGFDVFGLNPYLNVSIVSDHGGLPGFGYDAQANSIQGTTYGSAAGSLYPGNHHYSFDVNIQLEASTQYWVTYNYGSIIFVFEAYLQSNQAIPDGYGIPVSYNRSAYNIWDTFSPFWHVGDYTPTEGPFSFSSVPEPSAAALMLFAGAVWFRRKYHARSILAASC